MTFFVKTKIVSVAIYAFLKIQRNLFIFKKEINTGQPWKEIPIVIVRARPKEHKYIQKLLWQHYYPFETTTVALGLGERYNPVFDDQAEQVLSEGHTLIAKSKYTGEILGVSLNRCSCPWDPDFSDAIARSISCQQTRELLHFHAYIQRLPSLWKKYRTNRIFEILRVSVKENDRGKGIGILLTEASRKLGINSGYKVIRIDATNDIIAKICQKLNFKLEQAYPYSSYEGNAVTKKKPFLKLPPSNTSVKIYVDTPLSVPSK